MKIDETGYVTHNTVLLRLVIKFKLNSGNCVCTKCGEKVTHQRGVKCTTLKCPECGNTMIREEMIKIKN